MAADIPISNFIQLADLEFDGISNQSTGMRIENALSDIAEGIELIKLWEGLELEAYPDPATKGPPITIGYGCTRYSNGSLISLGDKITKVEAEVMLNELIQREFLPELSNLSCWNELHPSQKSALLSYAWNMGTGFIGDYENFKSINTVLEDRKWEDVPRVLMLYSKGAGRIMLGLKRRRLAEGHLWQGKSVKEAYQLGSLLDK
jgi:lysozyme